MPTPSAGLCKQRWQLGDAAGDASSFIEGQYLAHEGVIGILA